MIIFKSIFIPTAEISFSPSVSDNHTGCLFFNCPSIPSVLKRKNPWSQLELVVQRKYKLPIEKAFAWLQVVFVFSMGNGKRHQKSTLNKLTKKGRKEEFFLYLRFILANIDLKMQKSGKLLESFNLHIVANILSEKSNKAKKHKPTSVFRHQELK